MPFGFDPGQYFDPATGRERQPTEKELHELTQLAPPLGYVILAAEDMGLEVVAEIVGPATTTGGYGTWEVVPRPKRKALTEWTGREPLGIAMTVLFDGFKAGRSVERPIGQMDRLAGSASGTPPSLVVMAGGVIPHDAYHNPNKRWVIDSLEWGDSIRNRDGFRVRQFADVTLLEFVQDDELVGLPAIVKRARKRGKAHTTARAGESLRDVAKRTGKKLADLKKLNKVRDGDRTLTKGQRIKLR